jgi:hypothetical protein
MDKQPSCRNDRGLFIQANVKACRFDIQLVKWFTEDKKASPPKSFWHKVGILLIEVLAML